MNKTCISSLVVAVAAGAQCVQAQESMDDVFAQMDGAVDVAPKAAEAVAPAAEVAAMSEVEALLEKGIDLYHEREFKAAEAALNGVLAKDPYNRVAMTYLERTAQRVAYSEARKQGAVRAKAMADVNAAWNPAAKAGGVASVAGETKGPSDEEIAIDAMKARLQGIVIPSLDFRDANIKDVVLFLTETCRRLDPEGVNILLMGMEDSDAADASNITISIVDMNLYEALQYIVEMASLKFEVKAKAVAIMPVDYVPETDMVLVSYDVIPEVGSEMESMAGGDAGGADDLFGDSSSSASTGPADVQGFFSIVDWPKGSSAVYQPNFHKLFVKNTPKNLAAVEDILDDLEEEAILKRSQQVNIEAKFVEFNEGALEELGFDWAIDGSGTVMSMGLAEGSYVPTTGYDSDSKVSTPNGDIFTDPVTGVSGGGTATKQSLFGNGLRSGADAFTEAQSGILSVLGGNPATMLFSNDTIDFQISALEQEGTADVLSAPNVTVKSGDEAIIRVVEVHRYPQDYDVETGQRTAPVVKPQDWEDRDLGVVLKVQPVVDAESSTIDMTLDPEITSFKGFDDYIVGYNSYESGGDNTELFGDGSALLARMPYFDTRTIQTSVTVADGQTLVMGGLVDERTETFRDQVPVLGDIPYVGRLFRSEGTRTSKKNLMVTVKATMVDEAGMTSAERAAQ